jgi:predicted anti-sigma-YlaC factor YlaD
MNCDEVNGKLEAMFDGSLDSKSRKIVAEHLSVCQKCQADWHQMEELRRLMRRSLVAAPSDVLDERTFLAFEDRWPTAQFIEASRAPWWKRWLMIPVPAFGLAFTLLFGLILSLTFWYRAGDQSSKGFVRGTAAKKVAGADSGREVIDLSRFDHGDPAVIYVERNPNPQSIER